MAAASWKGRRPRTIIASALVTVATLTVSSLAIAYEGAPSTEVDLHDGSVWITQQSTLLVGHFNAQSTLLDGSLRAASEQYDILQDGAAALVWDQADSSVSLVDGATVALQDRVEIPAGAEVAFAKQTVAILEPEEGELFVVPLQGLAGFSVAETDPVASLGDGAVVTVGTDGTVYAASIDEGLVTVPVSGAGEPLDPQTRELDLPDTAELQLSSVGRTAVLLDSSNGILHLGDGTQLTIEARGMLRLAEDSAQHDTVELASETDLIAVPLDGSDVVLTPTGLGAATPATPVWVAGCAFSAWQETRHVMRRCLDPNFDLTLSVEGDENSGELRYRVNRDVVILNDVASGAAWLASDSMQQVDNWNELTPPDDGEAEEDQETTEDTLETAPANRTDVNTPPVAVDDAFGVRAGTTTILPVLDNDSDPDGDVLVIDLPEGSPDLGEVQVIQNGGALQVSVPEGASGQGAFTYRVNDGREGGTDTARVTLAVFPEADNKPPMQHRVLTIPVEAGGSVTYNILPDWRDPEGDEMHLTEVTPAEGDEVDFSADGRIRYRATAGTQGPVEVPIVVSDGELAGAGVLKLDIRPPGTSVPITNADHVVVVAGRTATVSPLANDISASSDPLRLTRVDEVEGLSILPDYAEKTFSVSGTTPGSYYVTYLATAGPSPAQGIVRVDVVAESSSDLPPIAVRDIALLPGGGEVLVGALDNDIDPGGGVLVIQTAQAAPDTGVSVSVVGHEALRIVDRAQLAQQVTITYQISNGRRTAVGEVVIIPVPAPNALRAPVAADDQAVVRAGDVVTIPVLDNDYHPNDDEIHLVPELVEAPVAEDGLSFTTQDVLRFQAGDVPKTVYATYEVIDSAGQKDSGLVTIQILPRDDARNEAPRPQDVLARALAGEQAIIPIPLDGIDPDGDSVGLIGMVVGPRLGEIVATESNHFVYRAYDDAAGSDTFTYRVRDALGAEGVATVRVGVAPRESVNQPPFAVTDAVVVRPGRVISVPVLANDSDPEGGALGIVPDGLVLPDVPGLAAEVIGNRVEVTAPNEELETSLQYTITDDLGATGVGVIKVTVSADVPLEKPIARDDYIKIEDVNEDFFADVAVLANDEDPDGTISELTLEIDSGELIAADTGTVRIEILADRRLVGYTLTDQDGLSTRGYIHVPSQSDLSPVLIGTNGVTVGSGQSIDIPLADFVRAPSLRPVVITEAGSVRAGHSNGGSLVRDQSTLTYTSVEGYSGADSISFEVTDGTGPDDPEGRKATLSIPITVLPPENVPPVVEGAIFDIAAGDEPVTLDLAPFATDEDGDPLIFSLAQGMEGVSIELTGTVLTGSAPADAAGVNGQVLVQISDGTADPVTMTIQVRVTASNRPLPVAVDDVIDRSDQGATTTVSPLDNDVNPFPDTPLKIETATADSGDVSVQVVGDRVEITSSDTFVGTAVVRYRISDATGAEERMVEGRIRVTVQGVPSQTGRPQVVRELDRRAVISWTPPSSNGSPITGYQVSSVDGAVVQSCPTTTCTITPLSNNVEYRFVVTAINAVGESVPSLPSDVARPDARPDQPAPPTIPAFGDGSLTVSWLTPSTPGSPVTSYTLEISPAPPNGVTQKTGLTALTTTWTGLQNGTQYQFRVRAHNRAPEPSDWSTWSATDFPAAPPAAPAAPTVATLDPVGAQAQMQVSWAAPATNGGPLTGYALEISRGGAVVQTLSIAPGTLSQAVTLDTSTTDYTFRVRAGNKAGAGAWSNASVPRRAYAKPNPPTITAGTARDRAATLGWTYTDSAGVRAADARFQISMDGGAWANATVTPVASGFTAPVSGLTNGQSYTFRVRTVYQAPDGPLVTSDPSAPSAAVVPFGKPFPAIPGASPNRNKPTEVVLTMKVGDTNGRPIETLQWRIDGGNWESYAPGSLYVHYAEVGYNGTATIEVRQIDTEGTVSDIDSASASTGPEPVPQQPTSGRGARFMAGDCLNPECSKISVTTYDNFPQGTYDVTCHGIEADGTRSDWMPSTGTTVTLGPNTTADTPCTWGFPPGSQAWVTLVGYGDTVPYTQP